MKVRQHPYVDQAVSRYYARHKAKLDKALESMSGTMKDGFLGLLLLPNEPEHKRRKSAKKKRIASPPPSFIAVVSDIVKGDVSKQAAARESVVKNALSSNGLPVDDFSVIHVSGLWDRCCDATTEPAKLERFRRSLIFADDSFLSTFILALHQKELVVNKFEKYVVCYCFSGSSVRGTRTSRSDLDVFCVIDDTDVKKMTLTELKDKLRAIILGMGYELAQEFSIPLDLNVQVYVLTDFWEALRDSNPIIFTMVRDGVPLYDKGMFVAWKRLLRTGRIRCSAEGTYAYAGAGEKAFEVAGGKISSAGTEDLYYTLLCYAQAILACEGSAPIAPSETLSVFRKRYLKAPYAFDRQAFATLKKALRLRKEVEHGRLKRLTPSRVAELYEEVKAAKDHFAKLFEHVERESRQRKINGVHEYLNARLGEAVDQLAGHHPAISLDEASSFVRGMPTPRGVARTILAGLKRQLKSKSSIKTERLEAITRQAVSVGDATCQAVDVLIGAASDFVDLGAQSGKWLMTTDGKAILALPLDWSRFSTPLRAQHAPSRQGRFKFTKGDVRDLLIKREKYLGFAAGKRPSYDIDGIRAALEVAVCED